MWQPKAAGTALVVLSVLAAVVSVLVDVAALPEALQRLGLARVANLSYGWLIAVAVAGVALVVIGWRQGHFSTSSEAKAQPAPSIQRKPPVRVAFDVDDGSSLDEEGSDIANQDIAVRARRQR